MSEIRPVRLQLSRRKGFDLRSWSREVNGLDVVNCARPGKLGNPFRCLNEEGWPLVVDGDGACISPEGDAEWVWDEIPSALVSLFRERAVDHLPSLAPLRGKNLACWCRLCARHVATGRPFDEPCPDCAPCHVDVLGDLTNAPVCEATP